MRSLPSKQSSRSAKLCRRTNTAIQRLEPRQLLCGLPYESMIEAPDWSDAIEHQYASSREGGPEAVSIVWSNRGQASDNFTGTFGTSAEAGRLVVDAALRHWERVITSFNRSDGTSTLQVNVSIGGAAGFGGAGAPAATAPADGKPRTGSFTLRPGNATPDPNDSNGWYFDPTPDDWAEYDGSIINAYAANPTSSLGTDLYSVVNAEMSHVLGLIADKNNDGGSWNGYRLESSGLATSTGIRDSAEGGNSFGFFWTFDGPNIDHLMTSYNSGDQNSASWGNIIHTSGGGGNINFNNVNWRGGEDSGNASGGNERTIPSYTVAQILADAYGYSIVDPENFGTMHANLNRSNGVLTIRGGGSATSSDVIVLDFVNGEFVVTVDVGDDVPGTGPLAGAGNIDAYVSRFPLTSVNSIIINGGGGTDYIRVERNAGKPVQVNGEAGDDFIDFGFYSQTLDNQGGGSFSLSGGTGYDQVFCYDNANPDPDTYTITSARFDRPFWAGFFYSSDLEALNLTTGTAANTVNVQSTFAGQPIWLWSAGGTDTVNIGNSSSGISSINANVTVNNNPSFTTLNINNGPDTGARTWNVDAVGSLGYLIGMAPATIYWDNADIQAINLTCGSGVDTGQFVISSETFNLNNAGGNDFITVGVPAAGGAQLITGQLTIDNAPAFTTLTIDDTGNGSARTVTIDETGGYNTVSGLAPALIRFDSFDTLNTTVITGSGIDTVNMPRNDDDLRINTSGGNDIVNIGNATDGVRSITGALTIRNTPSFSTVNINNGPDTAARNPTLQNVTVDGNILGQWTGLAPAAISYRYLDVSAVNVTFGTAADAVVVRQTQKVLNLTTTGGLDTYTLGGALDGAQSVQGTITLTNPPNHNIITVDDASNSGARTVTLDDVTISGAPYGQLIGLAPATINWKYNDTTSITLIQGSGYDSLTVRRHQKPLTIQSSGGADTVTLGGVAGIGMNGITASTTVSNSSGFTTLVLDDATDTAVSGPSTVIHEMNTLLMGRVTGMSPAPIDYRFGQVNNVRLRTSQGGPNNIVVIRETSPLTRVFYDPGANFETLYVNDDSIGSAALYTDRNVNPNTTYAFAGGSIIQQPGGNVFRTANLQILSGGMFDVSDGAMIIDYNSNDFAGPDFVRDYILQGYNGGNWQGFGIRSSTAAATPGGAVGYANSAALFSSFPATFVGQAVDDTTFLVRYTLAGDATLDRSVNLDDFTRLAGSFGQTGRVFSEGDFNYSTDGTVNLDDFTILAAQFGRTLPSAGGVARVASGQGGLVRAIGRGESISAAILAPGGASSPATAAATMWNQTPIGGEDSVAYQITSATDII